MTPKFENVEVSTDKQIKYFTHLFNSIKSCAILALDTGGRIRYANPASSILGFTEEELYSLHYSDIYKKASENQGSVSEFEDECWIARKDGAKFWARLSLSPIIGESGKAEGFSLSIVDLSEQKSSELSLRQSEEKYRLLVDSVKDYEIVMLDPTGIIMSWNEGAQRLKGYTADEAIGKHFSIFYTAEELLRKKPQKELELAAKTGKFQEEGWRVRKDKTLFWANVVVTAMFDEKNKLIGFSKVTRDLTEKRIMEEALRESEERYRLLVKDVKDYSIFMLDEEGNIASWNEGARRIKGYTDEEVIGKHFSIFLPQEEREAGKAEKELEIARREGKFEEEAWRIRKDGTRFWANVVISAIYNKDRKLIGFTKITRDLTEQKAAQDAIKASEERYRLLVKDVKDYAIFMLDPKGRISSWNEGARRIKGYEDSEIIGKHFSIFIPEEDRNTGKAENELKTAIEDGKFEEEAWRVRKSGERFWASVVITPVYNKNNELIGFTKITRDLTERRNAELALRQSQRKYRALAEQLKESNKELISRNEELEQFTSVVSHDLQEPLRTIHSYLDLIALRLDIPDGPVKGYLEKATAASARMREMIISLLEYSKFSQEKIELQEVNVRELLDIVLQSLRGSIVKTGAKIETDLQVETVQADRIQLSQVFQNLISNALKFTDSEKPLVRISSKELDNTFQFTVSDNGIGIPSQNINQVFEVFKRLHSSKQYPGTGIGLSICKKIIERHEGRIWVESELGMGTSFHFSLPKEVPLALK